MRSTIRQDANSGNSRNGTRAKTVLTEVGPVEIEVPRDTASTFEPQIVKKRQRMLTGVDESVLSLTARGLTTGEIAAHFQKVCGAKVSKDTISRITEKVGGLEGGVYTTEPYHSASEDFEHESKKVFSKDWECQQGRWYRAWVFGRFWYKGGGTVWYATALDGRLAQCSGHFDGPGPE